MVPFSVAMSKALVIVVTVIGFHNFVLLSSCVRLPGKCPKPLIPSSPVPEFRSRSNLHAMISLDYETDPLMFSDRWELKTPTCQMLSLKKSDSTIVPFYISKSQKADCDIVSGNLTSVEGRPSYYMEYKLFKKPKSNQMEKPINHRCFQDITFKRNIFMWTWNESFFLFWTCDDFFFFNEHDMGVLLFTDMQAEWNIEDIIETWLNFTALKPKHFQLKAHIGKCLRLNNCIQYDCLPLPYLWEIVVASLAFGGLVVVGIMMKKGLKNFKLKNKSQSM